MNFILKDVRRPRTASMHRLPCTVTGTPISHSAPPTESTASLLCSMDDSHSAHVDHKIKHGVLGIILKQDMKEIIFISLSIFSIWRVTPIIYAFNSLNRIAFSSLNTVAKSNIQAFSKTVYSNSFFLCVSQFFIENDTLDKNCNNSGFWPYQGFVFDYSFSILPGLMPEVCFPCPV